MSEQPTKPPISDKEVALLQENLVGGAFHIALGYLVTLRTSTQEQPITLSGYHKNALEKLLPGEDYDGYVKMHTDAFNYLAKNSGRFKIQIDG